MYVKNIKNKEIVNLEIELFMIYFIIHESYFYFIFYGEEGLKYKFTL
jgi:hypothetical protein